MIKVLKILIIFMNLLMVIISFYKGLNKIPITRFKKIIKIIKIYKENKFKKSLLLMNYLFSNNINLISLKILKNNILN